MFERILSKMMSNKTIRNVLGINSSCRNRHILKSQQLNTERFIPYPHHRLVVLVGGSPPSGDSGTQTAPSCNSTISESFTVPACRREPECGGDLDCLRLKGPYHFCLHFHWPECSHAIPAEPRKRLGNAISYVPGNRKRGMNILLCTLFLSYCIENKM